MKSWIFLLLLSFNLAAYAHPEVAPTRPETWAQSVHSAANLYRVDDKLYRSEQPIGDDVAILSQNKINSIINLRYFNRKKDQQIFSSHAGVKLINQPLLTWRVKPKHIAAVLYQIEQNQKDGAVLVHCYHGADRTGIVVAFYRMVYQNWSLDAAKAEMMGGGFGYHSVWKNLENLFTEQNLADVKAELNQLRQMR